MRMRVKVAALRIEMPDGNRRAESDVRVRVLHTVPFERMLKFGAHEAVAIAGVREDEEVDLEHRHVEEERDADEADGAGDKVTEEERHRQPRVAKQEPKLYDCRDADRRHREESDPFARQYRSQGQPDRCQPDPPSLRKRLVSVLVGEAGPAEGGETGEEDEGRVQQDMPGLSDEAVFEGDEEGGEEGRGRPTRESAHGEVGERDEGDPKDSGQHAHRNVGHVVRSIFAVRRVSHSC